MDIYGHGKITKKLCVRDKKLHKQYGDLAASGCGYFYEEKQNILFGSFRQMSANDSTKGSPKCTAIILDNLVQPEWISVSCHKPLLSVIACFDQGEDHHLRLSSQNKSNLEKCSKTAIQKQETCFSFFWHVITTNRQTSCNQLGNIAITMTRVKMFNFIFEAVSSVFPPFYSCNFKIHITIEKYLCDIRYHSGSSTEKGMVVYSRDLTRVIPGPNVFLFSNNEYFGLNYVHLGPSKCSNKIIGTAYLSAVTANVSEQCSGLCYQTHRGKCSLFHHKEDKFAHNLFIKTALSFQQTKFDSKQFTVQPVNMNPEEYSTAKTMKKYSVYECLERGFLPCLNHRDNRGCFSIGDICLYKLHSTQIVPCKGGGHLQNCNQFECNSQLKCPSYHCIPWSYVCDGKWDCPSGFDESWKSFCTPKRICSDMFHCHKSQICIHLASNCDGENDCPQGDDEELCSLLRPCPLGCNCLFFGIDCSEAHLTKDVLNSTQPHISFFAEHSTITCQICIQSIFRQVYLIVIRNSNLTKICEVVKNMKTVIKVDFGINSITVLSGDCFRNNFNLSVLKLNHNKVMTITAVTFNKLNYLKHLDLSSNPLQYLCLSSSTGSLHIAFLSLVNNNLTVLNLNIFQNVLVKVLFTDNYKLCCLANTTLKCSVRPVWYKTCSRLLPKYENQVTFAFMSFLLFVVSVMSIVIQIICNMFEKTRKLPPFSVFVFTANSVDCTCSLPLLLIWINDHILKEKFVVEEFIWRTGAQCWITFFCFLSCNILSPIFHCLVSFARFMMVNSPMNTRFKQLGFVSKCIISTCLPTLSFCVLMTVLTWMINSEIPSQFCISSVDPLKRVIMIQFLTWLTGFFADFFNYIYFLLLSSGYHIFKNIKRKHKRFSFQRNIKHASLCAGNYCFSIKHTVLDTFQHHLSGVAVPE